jgi:hypothetical protein
MALEARGADILDELQMGTSLRRLTGVRYLSDDESLSVRLITSPRCCGEAWKGEGDDGEGDDEGSLFDEPE